MGFYSEVRFIIRCDSPGCDNVYEKTVSSGSEGVRTAVIMRVKALGWEREQRIGGEWDICFEEEGGYADYTERTHKAWFCPECAKSGRIAEWHDMIKTEYPRDVEE